jgi:hypothetical protein
MMTENSRRNSSSGLLWHFVTLAGFAVAVGLLGSGARLSWPCLSFPQPHEFGFLLWGLNLLGAGVPLLTFCCLWLFQARKR